MNTQIDCFRLIAYLKSKCSMCIYIMFGWEKPHRTAAECQLCCSDDIAEDWTPPGPGAVRDDVSRVVAEWSVVGVELARLVTGTVVVRVTARWQRTVEHALQTKIHLDSAHDVVDHLLSLVIRPLPTCVITTQCPSNFTVRSNNPRSHIRCTHHYLQHILYWRYLEDWCYTHVAACIDIPRRYT